MFACYQLHWCSPCSVSEVLGLFSLLINHLCFLHLPKFCIYFVSLLSLTNKGSPISTPSPSPLPRTPTSTPVHLKQGTASSGVSSPHVIVDKPGQVIGASTPSTGIKHSSPSKEFALLLMIKSQHEPSICSKWVCIRGAPCCFSEEDALWRKSRVRTRILAAVRTIPGAEHSCVVPARADGFGLGFLIFFY